MKSASVTSIESLNGKLAYGKKWANGKNFPVDHLHATIAESRWDPENIFGIYLTNESYAWMALWMAISNRSTLRKRQIGYQRPDQNDDHIGSVEIFTEMAATEVVGEKGYVYLFDPIVCSAGRQIVDITELPKDQKTASLINNGFEWQQIERRGREVSGLIDLTLEPRVVLIDAWQLALTNTVSIIPDEELIIEKPVIEQLVGRIALTRIEIGEDYIR